MMRFLAFVFCLLASLPGAAQLKSVKLAELAGGTFSPNSVSLAINHKDLKNRVAAIGLNRLLYSLDGGKTWSESNPGSPFENAGETVVISDFKGNFHYIHLARSKDAGDRGPDRILCQTSIDNGMTWTPGVSIGDSPSKVIAGPRVSGHFEESDLYMTWTQFDAVGLPESACQSNVMFSHSSHGKRWSDPVKLNQTPGNCKNDAGTANAVGVVVNPEGRLFAVWLNQGSIYFDRSYNEGETWLSTDITVAKHPGGSLMNIPGMANCSGLPSLVIDNSASFFRGSLYVVWADQSKGANDTDIWLARSINRGDTWTKAQRVNKDGEGKHQFLPAMTVDQTTGIAYVIYYDRRDHDDLLTDVYLAYSLDGTNHFNEIKISESSFLLPSEKSAGEYIGIVAYKGVIAPIWTSVNDGQVTLWTMVIRQEELFKKDEMPKLQTLKKVARPHPAN